MQVNWGLSHCVRVCDFSTCVDLSRVFPAFCELGYAPSPPNPEQDAWALKKSEIILKHFIYFIEQCWLLTQLYHMHIQVAEVGADMFK